MGPPDAGLADLSELVELSLGLAGRIQAHYRARVAEFDLTPGEGGLLLALSAEHGRAMGDLAGAVRMDRSNLSTVIDRLQRRGLVQRRPDPRDGRGRLVALSAAGRRTRDALERRIGQDNPALAGLTAGDRQQLRTLLRRNHRARTDGRGRDDPAGSSGDHPVPGP